MSLLSAVGFQLRANGGCLNGVEGRFDQLLKGAVARERRGQRADYGHAVLQRARLSRKILFILRKQPLRVFHLQAAFPDHRNGHQRNQQNQHGNQHSPKMPQTKIRPTQLAHRIALSVLNMSHYTALVLISQQSAVVRILERTKIRPKTAKNRKNAKNEQWYFR